MENKYVEFAKLVALFLAVVLPVPVIGYIIHTPASITVSYLSFVIIGLVFPFFWYMAQKKGFYSLKGFVNGVLRNIARELPDMKFEDLSIQYSTPKWIVDQWVSEYGQEKATQMLAD